MSCIILKRESSKDAEFKARILFGVERVAFYLFRFWQECQGLNPAFLVHCETSVDTSVSITDSLLIESFGLQTASSFNSHFALRNLWGVISIRSLMFLSLMRLSD